jgi:type VI secretion system VasD/TssJ family lipoprotein
MIKGVIGFCLLLLTFIICSCAPIPVAPVDWRYEESAIRLNVTADPMLNLYDGRAHALHVCVYQLRNHNAFNRLAETPEGISNLLQCRLFDPEVVNAGVLSRSGIQPDHVQTFTLDRAEGAKYLAIVAGYQILEKERAVWLFHIPVVGEIVITGLQKIERIQTPGILTIDLYLGAQQIQKAVIREWQKEN